jgi:hypothetical protein
MQSIRTVAIFMLAVSLSLSLGACIDDGGPNDDDNEIISRVELTFTPETGAPLVFAFDDPDGDGGVSGVAERIELAADTTYALSIRFENGLADPPEDLTEEIEAEAEQHLVFVLGDVAGPASTVVPALLTHAYADLESDYGTNAIGEDLPVGLRNTVSTDAAGTGELRIILRHLPELNGEPQKSGELPGAFADGDDLPGAVDVDVVFELVIS